MCVYGIESLGGGPNVQLACRTVTVPGGSPIGVIDAISGGKGSIHIAGWALDPDTAASIPIHVYVDGIGHIFAAGATRPDVGAVFPEWGNLHGIDLTYGALAPGNHTVCTYAINVGLGTGNPKLGCRTVRT